MSKYYIRYTETYADEYEIKAESYMEACDKLRKDIMDGKVDGPDQCIDSKYSFLDKTEI